MAGEIYNKRTDFVFHLLWHLNIMVQGIGMRGSWPRCTLPILSCLLRLMKYVEVVWDILMNGLGRRPKAGSG